MCQAGTPIVCNDDIECTVDACDDTNGGACVFAPDDGFCSDDLYCTGVETCDPVNGAALTGCVDGQDISCGDQIDCTDDSCDEDADACAFVPDHASCSNDTFCDGEEICDPALDCIDADPVDCNDLIACTVDACDEGMNQCTHTPDDAVCDDGLFCNGAQLDGAETCMAGLGCVAANPTNCPGDGQACTIEACDEIANACQTTLDNNQCMAGQFCTNGGCIAGAQCSVLDGVMNNPDCDDNLACNGQEICFDLPGPNDQCQPGTPINCADAFACTTDTCQNPGGTCQHTPVNAACSDGNPCDGSETCSAAVGCQEGAPLNCDDNVACTQDLCIMNFGCNNIAADESCSDNLFCNGEETCDLQQGCQPAQNPVVCPSDGIACTTEACNEAINQCETTADDDACPCGETCQPALGGCDGSCSPATCQGNIYECGNCMDDDDDCDVDANDSNCFGPCSNNEDGLAGLIPGQQNSPCKQDCYFDKDSGAGNDDCYWSHECDMLEPSAPTCDYDPNANIPGYPGNNDCVNALMSQSDECEMFCEPLTPNGCDCFGCCTVDLPGMGLTNIYLGTTDDGSPNGNPTCATEVWDDPNVLDLCEVCTKVPACDNPCGNCELCFGQTELPPECGGMQECFDGAEPCGLPGQAPCPPGEFCLTGCCQQG
jgi:hypothetical protein